VSASSHTAPSHASLFTSLYPEQHKVLVNGVALDQGIPSMADLFRSHGFQTAAFTSVGFLESLRNGFEFFDGEMPRKARYRGAAQTTGRVQRWLAGRDRSRPLFLWLHFYDPHEHGPGGHVPKALIEDLRSESALNGEALLEFLRQSHGLRAGELHGNFDRYDAQIRLVDSQLRRLYKALKAQPLPGSTLWVVTADHGEGMGNHDYFGHGRFLYNEQLRVPLLLHAPDGELRPRRVSHLVRHVDLLPTVAELAGVPLDRAKLRVEGRSLVPVLEEDGAQPPVDFAYSQRRPADQRRLELGWVDGYVMAVQDDRYKYILNSLGDDELYDLMTDPHESRNLIGEELPAKRRLLEWLEEKRRALQADGRTNPSSSLEIEKRYIESLKALGYM